MYGIVNKAIQGLVTENFGESTWLKVKEKSCLTVDGFLSSDSYPDEVTYRLAGAAAEVLDMSLENVLIAFGEYWILHTGLQHYGALMSSGGNDLKEFLINLPSFHSRVMLLYPNLTPPEFKITDIKEDSLAVHYFSEREGLQYFVVGLLQGLGKMYQVETNIKILQSRDDHFDHEVFHIDWH